jgi:hypothetical protein
LDIKVGGDLGLDSSQERQELGGPMTGVQRSDDLAGGQIQRGVQARGAVPNVIVAGPRRGAGQHGEHRCGAVERLDLSLLIHAQHQRAFRRIQVQPDHVAHFCHEQRILGQLPRMLFMRG